MAKRLMIFKLKHLQLFVKHLRVCLGMYPFRVQIIGAAALHEGNIAEMKTGEGKTLTSTLSVYLNALAGKGVHVVTVNEYLASRDADGNGSTV